MRRKLTCLLMFTAAIVVTALQAGNALATLPGGFRGTTLAQGRFGEISVFNHLILPNPSRSRHRNLWLSSQKTKGMSDLYVQSNVWEPGGSTGWHTHPGHSLITVIAGTVRRTRGTIPSASPTCTRRGWGSSIPVATTCTFSGTKAPSRHAPSLFRSYRPVRRVGSTRRTRGTVRSDDDPSIRRGYAVPGRLGPPPGSGSRCRM
jgi:hypothetical protein